LTEKITQKVSSNERIVIPKEWRDKLALEDRNDL
jgi:AbrB family looped-hinge helix DNA binding protein